MGRPLDAGRSPRPRPISDRTRSARRAPLAPTLPTLLVALTALSTGLAVLWPGTAAAQGAKAPADTPRAMTLVDIINTPRIGSPRLSPDGKRLVYVQSDADWKKDERVSHLWLVNADGSGARQLTRGDDGESDPRWSPDGTRIAFLAARKGSCEAPEESGEEGGERGEAGLGRRRAARLRRLDASRTAADTTPAPCDPDHPHRQVWILSLQGGEARPLTHHASSVSDITWSPDGRWVYFTAPDPETKAEAARKKAKNDVYAFDESYHQVHLWRVDARPAGEAEPEAPVPRPSTPPSTSPPRPAPWKARPATRSASPAATSRSSPTRSRRTGRRRRWSGGRRRCTGTRGRTRCG